MTRSKRPWQREPEYEGPIRDVPHRVKSIGGREVFVGASELELQPRSRIFRVDAIQPSVSGSSEGRS